MNDLDTPAVIGHNEGPIMADAIKAAKHALKGIGKADTNSFEGWLEYGKALNDLRALYPSDREFGTAVKKEKLDTLPGVGNAPAMPINRNDRASAMWASANPDQLQRMRGKDSKVRTLRGLHAMWMKHIGVVAAGKALNEIEDDAEAAAVIAAVAAETGIPADLLDEARTDLIVKDRKAADRAAKRAATTEANALATAPAALAALLDVIGDDPRFHEVAQEIAALRETAERVVAETPVVASQPEADAPPAPAKRRGRPPKVKPQAADADALLA